MKAENAIPFWTADRRLSIFGISPFENDLTDYANAKLPRGANIESGPTPAIGPLFGQSEIASCRNIAPPKIGHIRTFLSQWMLWAASLFGRIADKLDQPHSEDVTPAECGEGTPPSLSLAGLLLGEGERHLASAQRFLEESHLASTSEGES
jgi:hypothetical protein